ncbi:MAG TPA: O-antigen ligase family protein [Solirubrobacteraceae bacterium]|jgi:O-antigen ligase|nr:O-antigen ligase family protein [Solirubrobacteraceae bacterium]
MAARRLPLLTPRVVVALALLSAAAIGVVMAVKVGPGTGATVALLYAPIVLLNLPLGIGLWLVLIFLKDLPFVWVGPSAASVLVLVAWPGYLRGLRRDAARRGVALNSPLRHHRLLSGLVLALVVWITLSMAWAPDTTLGADELWTWYVAGLVFFIVATVLRSERTVRTIVIAFVVGATLTVAVGLALTGLAPANSAIQSAAQFDGRLSGGAGDPNYLAAGLVPALALAGALFALTKHVLARWALLVAITIMVIGLAASQSRGGILAAAAATATALVVFRGRRLQVAGVLVLLLSVSGAWFASSPGALQRVTNFNGGGTGRSDLWTVAWRIGNEHPVIGVGINNFLHEEQLFVRRPGPLRNLDLIVDKPHVAHNIYLQLFAETGVVGVSIYLMVMLLFMLSAWRAGERWERLGEPGLALISRAVLVGQAGVMVALIFLSDGADERFWVLYALGPALLSLAYARERAPQLSR